MKHPFLHSHCSTKLRHPLQIDACWWLGGRNYASVSQRSSSNVVWQRCELRPSASVDLIRIHWGRRPPADFLAVQPRNEWASQSLPNIVLLGLTPVLLCGVLLYAIIT